MEYMCQAESVMYHPGNVLSGECYVAGSLSSKMWNLSGNVLSRRCYVSKWNLSNNVSSGKCYVSK